MVKVIYDELGQMQDILLEVAGKELAVLEGAGKERELKQLQLVYNAEKDYTNVLPIFLGVGCGFAIAEYCTSGRKCIVIDAEKIFDSIQKEHGIQKEQIYYIDDTEEANLVEALNVALYKEGYPLCITIQHPFHARHNKEVYRTCADTVQKITSGNPFGALQYKKFKGSIKILCIWNPSFITYELQNALLQENIECEYIEFGGNVDGQEYISTILEKITVFKPDFIFTVNHTCFDDKGFLGEILWNTKIPIASWFMDSPELDIEKQSKVITDYTTVFSYDAQNIEYLHNIGFTHAYYLPLGTDIQRFIPNIAIPHSLCGYKNTIGYLGNSHAQTIKKYTREKFTVLLHKEVHAIAEVFRMSLLYTVGEVIEEYSRKCYEEYLLLNIKDRREYMQYVIDLATQKKRILDIINANILPITVSGDIAWKKILQSYKTITWKSALPYSQAHFLYAQCEMILNSTCTQMKHSVNQRVFDCPSSGAFILTEKTEQLQNLFDIGTEVVCYTEKEELQEIIRYYHEHTAERMKIIHSARKRIIQEHTWQHRIRTIIRTMQTIYG